MTREPNVYHFLSVSVLFFLSGWAALVYEVLWMKELSLLFGNSSQAAAATLAAFLPASLPETLFGGVAHQNYHAH